MTHTLTFDIYQESNICSLLNNYYRTLWTVQNKDFVPVVFRKGEEMTLKGLYNVFLLAIALSEYRYAFQIKKAII